ncbi:tautomerase family protein [Alkalibacter mobilis]|uniref:tautomerase family protein n=1 Tax=Alkalibacter mobilis TaxID=2787712 RepID=UPI00189DBC49|nr:hypothetical protein [Alkalibacter mobilis]MBF7096977.1 hypothetical protein [Alkalibacter mobilis]
MPYVDIKTDFLMENIDVRTLNKNICDKLSVPRSRIKISWAVFHEDHFCNHPPEDCLPSEMGMHRPIVQITVSKRNDRSFVGSLVKAVVEELCMILNTKEENVLVLIYYLDQGDIFINGSYV